MPRRPCMRMHTCMCMQVAQVCDRCTCACTHWHVHHIHMHGLYMYAQALVPNSDLGLATCLMRLAAAAEAGVAPGGDSSLGSLTAAERAAVHFSPRVLFRPAYLLSPFQAYLVAYLLCTLSAHQALLWPGQPTYYAPQAHLLYTCSVRIKVCTQAYLRCTAECVSWRALSTYSLPYLTCACACHSLYSLSTGHAINIGTYSLLTSGSPGGPPHTPRLMGG